MQIMKETQSESNDWQTMADYRASQFTFSSPGQVDGKFGDQAQVQHTTILHLTFVNRERAIVRWVNVDLQMPSR